MRWIVQLTAVRRHEKNVKSFAQNPKQDDYVKLGVLAVRII
jgi:hypothetical protein